MRYNRLEETKKKSKLKAMWDPGFDSETNIYIYTVGKKLVKFK